MLADAINYKNQVHQMKPDLKKVSEKKRLLPDFGLTHKLASKNRM